jgi:hypothetical protein
MAAAAPAFNHPVGVACACETPAGNFLLAPDSDETLLFRYKEDFMPLFPWVVMPPGLPAQELKKSWPFLMAAVRMVASHGDLMSVRGKMVQLMDYLTEHMLIRCEKRLDFLLGIIVMLGWCHWHCVQHSQMHNLIALGTSLSEQLGIRASPKAQEEALAFTLGKCTTTERTNAERRALLGLWYLSSTLRYVQNAAEFKATPDWCQPCLVD